MAAHEFEAELWEWHQEKPGSWHFVTLPLDVADELRLESGPRRGFGSIRVEATVGATTWRTSVFPEAGGGSFVLPVKQAVRRAEGLEAGGPCRVSLLPLS
ncbi:MAG TPA: DUF1905 domain-containing protein [Nocardioidaceae bacterium]|nr:DUF1905 domain-containing protein [Nocardioidaceae bacterium]